MDSEVYELPVSFAQRRIWLLDQFDPDGTAYLVPWVVRLDGPVDRDALAAALRTVVERHEALRTVFRAIDGQPVQVIGALVPDLSTVDLTGKPDPEAALAALADRAARERFDLDRGPLLRTTLVHLGPDRYALVLVTHHVVADGWSFGLLFDELATAYAAGVEGAAPALRELPIQYGDFALWQQDRWTEGGYAADEQYWQQELSGAPTTLALPTEAPRPPRQSYRGANHPFTVDPAVADGLRALAQRSSATLFMTLLSVYATVLSRYAGRTDLLIGAPVSGRTRPETEHLIGLFMNTLALRARMDDNPTFATLLDRLRTATAGALAHQELPFDRVVEMLQPERSLAQSPVVQVLFALDEAPRQRDAAGVAFAPSILDNGTAKFDVSMSLVDGPDGLVGELNYDADLFTPAWAQRFIGCVLRVARAVVADPDTRVGDIELLPDEMRAQVVDAWGTGPALDAPTGLTALLASTLDGPEPAVAAADATTSRADLARWAGRIAAVLRERGVGPESTVGLCLPRTSALVPALLGVWWAGGAYVPLDPSYPAERLRLMVADSGLRTVLTQSSLVGLVRGLAGPGVTVLAVDGPEVRNAEPVAPVETSPEALAYTIFTSGSTGRPKGVSVPRGAVESMLRAFATALPLGAGDKLVAVTTLSFDIAVLELLLPLVCGGQVVLADGATAADPNALRRLIAGSGATALQATPATWRMLVASGGIPAELRLRLCGGEALPPDLVDALTAGDAQAWNVYGPTETTVWSAAGRIEPSPAPVEVGPPIAGTHMLVLDAGLRPVPPGVVGEVYLGGAGVARGYHGRPALSAERFLPDPYGPPGARLYRTGDLARWRDSGRLDLLGRADHQVKIRGFRIEIGEVEAVLATHDGLAHAVVAAYTPTGGGDPTTHLIGYVVPRPSGGTSTVDSAALRRHLLAQLPEYMIPSTFVTLTELPLTPNGKVDRARLPRPDWGGDLATEHVPPDTPTQKRLVEIWSELLPPSAAIGIHENFFALGGHSLTATQLIARIRGAFGVDLPLRTLFTNATVAELAVLVDEPPDTGLRPQAGQVRATTIVTSGALDALDQLSDAEIDDLLRTLLPDEKE